MSLSKPLPRGKVKERILRVVLNNPGGDLSVYMISEEAQASYSWTYEYLKKLEDDKFVKDTEVLDFFSLFKIWINIRKHPFSRDYRIRNPLTFLENINYKFALTTYQAENILTGYLFPSRIDLYIFKKDYDKWHKTLVDKGLVGGGNFRILIDDDHVFYKTRTVRGLDLVSIPQLIVDLYIEGGPAGEAADRMIQEGLIQNVRP